jgi:hypothetical protein
MENDYPAAHSMDTAFFAVDKDGHVAYFTTGEAGALPQGAHGNPEELLQRLSRVVPAGQGSYDLEGRLTPGGFGVGGGHWSAAVPEPGGTLLFLKSLAPVREEIARGEARAVPAHGVVAVIFPDLPAALARRLHDAGECLGCFFHYQGDPEAEGAGMEPARHGLFYYAHLCENWISGPYGLHGRPAQPVHIDQLPPDLRARLQQTRFASLCFAETPYVQPIEHTECTSWESAYLASDFKTTRPMPGREEEYREVYEELAKAPGLEVEPPPESDHLEE